VVVDRKPDSDGDGGDDDGGLLIQRQSEPVGIS
jgi:hypothetical protein